MFTFSFLSGRYSVHRFALNASIPAPSGELWAALRIGDELTLVAPEGSIRDSLNEQDGWVAIKLHGPFDFSVTGVIAEISQRLAAASIAVFVLSTYDTDYILVSHTQQEAARAALLAGGHKEAA